MIPRPIHLRFLPLLLFLTAFSAEALTNLNLKLITNVKPSVNPISYGDVWADNEFICLGVWQGYSTYNYGVGIYSNPVAPVLLGIYNASPASQNQFELGAVRSKIGYFGSWSGGGVHIVSLTNPAAPVLLCRVGATTGNVTNGFDRVHTLFLERNFLYEAAHVPGIVTVKVFDVSNPSLPIYLQDIVTTNTTKVHQITVRNKGARTILYTSGWGGNNDGNPASPGQTDIWDVSNVGSQPAQWLGRIYSGYNSHSSYPTPDGNLLVVCRETPGGDVRWYDISNPATIPSNATPVVTLTPASMGLEPDIPHNPVVVSNFLFVSWYQNGIQVFDISDPTKPVRVGFYDTYPAAQTASYQGNWGVFPNLGFDKILLSDIQSGLFVLDGTGLLTPTNNYPPLFVTQPASLTVTQGVAATFWPTVTGSALKYQWQFNGANLPGATSNRLVLVSAQPADAGIYTLVVSNATATLTSSVASLSVVIPQSSQTVFYDAFDSSSSSTNWNLFDGNTNGISDYTADWSYDYSTYFSVYNGSIIPPAPGTTNSTTRGLRLTVNNNDGIPSIAALSLYPKNRQFIGAYKFKCDMWINYPGGPAGSGSSGSTEHATFGLNHAGTRVNWEAATAHPSDGVWFAIDGEGGISVDYRAYVGNSSASPTLLSFANSGFSASGAASRDSADAYWQSIFPSPAYESVGAPGKQWVQVELSQDSNNVVTWRMNGNLISQRVNSSPFTNGTIMLGYMDLFNSFASPAADAFVLFDNARVEVTTPLAPPAISAQPQNATVYPEQTATFSVAATGSAPMSFQWQFNGGNIPAATSNSFTRSNVQPEEVGYYSVVVSNAAGLLVSSNALLTLLDSPYISSVSATPGAGSALIAWNTTVPAQSVVQFDIAAVPIPGSASMSAAAGSFGSSSYLDRALTTNHVILLTGLSPSTRYSFQVISSAGTNNYVSGVYQFTTAGNLAEDFPTNSTIPIWWQNFYFGTTTDPSADPDHDRYTTAQEYVMGTSPTNANSQLQFLADKTTNSARVTFWPLLGNRTYQLLYRPEIGAPNWQAISPAITATPAGEGIFTVSITNAPRNFYRLKIQLTTNTAFSGSLAVPQGKTFSPFASDPICGPNRAYIR